MTIPQQLRRGLVAYWPLDEASGLAAAALYDAGGPYDLTDNNTVTSGAGPSNNLPTAREFTAANSEYLSISDMRTLERDIPEFTFTGFARITSGANRGIFHKWLTTGDQREFQLWYEDTNARLRFFWTIDGTAGTSSTASTAMSSVSNNTWFFWAVRANANDVLLSIDMGTPAQFSRGTIFTGTGAFEIGMAQSGTVSPMEGRLCAIAMHNRFLSDAELQWLYNNGNGRDLLRGV